MVLGPTGTHHEVLFMLYSQSHRVAKGENAVFQCLISNPPYILATLHPPFQNQFFEQSETCVVWFKVEDTKKRQLSNDEEAPGSSENNSKRENLIRHLF